VNLPTSDITCSQQFALLLQTESLGSAVLGTGFRKMRAAEHWNHPGEPTAKSGVNCGYQLLLKIHLWQGF
jgi:hypothetical protein